MKKIISLLTSLLLTITSLIFYSAGAVANQTPSIEISAHDYHNCAINSDKHVFCWGFSSTGAISVPENIGKASQVSIGGDSFFDHSCALTESGAVRCWGSNDSGQIDVPNDIGKVRQLDAGGKHTCAINEYSLLRCWGRNNFGQVSIPTDLGPVEQVSVGQWNTCVITEKKTVRCWGSNFSGQLAVPAGLEDVAQISTGSEHVCALKTNGQLLCWGVWWSSGPANLNTEEGKYTQVSSGPWNTCAVSIKGEVECWGFNQASLNAFWAKDDRRFRQVAAGLRHACAVQTSGNLVCYGDNTWGQLDVPTPIQMPGTNHYYLFVKGSFTLAQSHQLAESQTYLGLRGHLATISSAEENSWLLAVSPKMISWVGASDVGPDQDNRRNWVWQAGPEIDTKFTVCTSDSWANSCTNYENAFNHWNTSTGQPDGRGQDSGMVFAPGYHAGGSWFDAPPAEQNGFLVEFEEHTLSTLPVRIQGGGFVGSKLQAEIGAYPTGTSLSYQWLRDGVAIDGATEPQFLVRRQDLNHKISYQLVATKSGYESLVLTSSTLEITKRGFSKLVAPVVKGKSKVGSVLSASVTSMGSGVVYSYQWLRDGVAIEGTSERKYVLGAEDVNASVSFRVCGSKPSYETACLESNSSVVGLGELRRQPKVGLKWTSLKSGAVIQSRAGSWDAGVTLSYSWLRDGVEIANETEATYQLTDADRGHSIAFRVVAEKPGYNTVTRTTVAKLIP